MSVNYLIEFSRYGPLFVPAGGDLISKFISNYGWRPFVRPIL